MNETEAVVARAVACAKEVVQGTTAPYTGAMMLWTMEGELRELADALIVFVGLASEWEDQKDQRPAYEKEIVIQADRLMSRFGK